ncbi:MAG TPA: class I SAM-dependent methyltransferase, partial [Solirubrobacteraceae bacterium]|nr:class I SAM-dependent methyltransferase [Solirubrobacteraceae bacterium]
AGLADRVELRVAPAIETLRALPEDEVFDFAFIDADKVACADYYELTLARLRPGGLIVLDNVLMRGRVLDAGKDEDGVIAMRELNAAIAADARVDCAMVAVADGLTLVRKR